MSASVANPCLTLRQVLDTPEPLRNLAELIAAQLEYHKKAYEILSELAPVVDQLQVEQEVCSRQGSTYRYHGLLTSHLRPVTGRAVKARRRVL